MKKYGHSGSLTPSNFKVLPNDETCTGCGLCVKRCSMEALHLEDAPAARGRKTTIIDQQGKERQLTNKTGKVSKINTNLCIGCGVCAYKCPAKSLALTRNEINHNPPETGRDWAVQFISRQK
jgi:NAD-dependent dihydropyrimidine dehydrogenase PreA subunit